MDAAAYRDYVNILKEELVPAMGCTEPIAVAFAAAKAREVLGAFPDRMELVCSGNIIKNVKSVTVPNSGGLRGIDAAAILGVVGGDASRDLEVLDGVTESDIRRTRELMRSEFFACTLQEGVSNLYIVAKVYAGTSSASVSIVNRHTLISEIVRNGQVLYRREAHGESGEAGADLALLNLRDILEFAETVDLERVRPVLDRQIALNTAISQAGLESRYGAQVGRTLLEVYGDTVETRARARAAAGSDARMNGCSLPVVINSGSGNQGMTVSLPVIEYAEALMVPREKLYRALLISNLLAIHQKSYIGSLSAFCGAVTAACGSGAAITYLCGGTYQQISRTVVNTVANVGGIVCDGAKSSCAAKIASAVDAAILAHHLSMKGLAFQPGEGLVQEDVESTIRNVGYVGRVGMKDTDVEILNLMIGRIHPEGTPEAH